MEFTDQKKGTKKFSSKIPVPIKSLKNESRQPLKTLLDLDSNVPTNIQNSINEKRKGLRKSNSFSIADTRFVTVRPNEDVSCGFSVFNENDNKENVTNKKALTPSTLHKKRLKNIKKSLKRPHSRELQGVVSIAKSLSFTEEVTIPKRLLDNSNVKPHKFSCDATCNRVYGMDIFTYLFEKEEKTPYPTYLSVLKHRAFALNWLVDINSTGDPAVIQTAAWYFDTVLTIRKLKDTDLPVAITACFWISRKVHGKVCTARALVEKSGSVFDAEHLCIVEKRILRLLKIPCQPVVPQEFISYLAWWCDNQHPEEILLSASFICLCAMTLNLEMCLEYPSVIAAAAIRTALLLLKKQNLSEKLRGSFVYQAAIMKGDNIIEVCIAQIETLKMLFTDDFQFTAPKKLFKNNLSILEKLKKELNYLYNTGGEGIVRAFLMS
ncbi:uncharacterized protein LOC111004318 [Pieris rapae]|uniref:uncharacterized protein LOC111004318 n=1 Tax=Pieris rapae TaxID=64459 RepID=UPI001E27C70C|nr:uncharacterized protein LOC111004318 [Pieris rapae]